MNIETKIAALIAPLTESRRVVYTVQGVDGQYTFTSPTPAQAAVAMAELFKLGQLAPVAADYEDAPGAPSPSVPKFAHVLEGLV